MDTHESGASPRPPAGGKKRRLWAWLAVGVLVAATMPPLVVSVIKAHERARSMSCQSNFKQIGLGLLNYHDEFRTLPPAYVLAADATRTHSWRGLLAAFFDKTLGPQMYDYDLTDSWNGPTNLRLAERSYDMFACPSDRDTQRDPRLTNYFVVVGPNTAFPGDRSVSLKPIWNGRGGSHTLLATEACGMNVQWLEPRDLDYNVASQGIDPRAGPGRISSRHPQGPYAAMADGSVRSLHGISPSVLQAMLRIDDDAKPEE